MVWELSRTFLADSDGVVAVIRAFIDESGIHEGSPVVSVGGYFARPKTWKEFTRDWRMVLRPAGIECYHASDCQALRGEFEGWQPTERDALVKKLLPVIPRHSLAGIAMAIALRDYEAATGGEEWPDDLADSPYAVCFQWLLREIVENAQKANSREAIAIVHENNDFKKDADAAFDWVKENWDLNDNLHSLTFAPKEKYVPLQAADVLAFEAGKAVLSEGRLPRRSLSAIAPRGKRPIIKRYNKNNMALFVATMRALRASVSSSQA